MGYRKKVLRHLSTKKNEASREDDPIDNIALTASLRENLELCKEYLGDSSDVVIKEFTFGCSNKHSGAILLIDGLVNIDIVELNILKPLMYDTSLKPDACSALNIDTVNHALVSSGDVKKRSMLSGVLNALLSGDTILFVDGSEQALSIGTRKWEKTQRRSSSDGDRGAWSA